MSTKRPPASTYASSTANAVSRSAVQPNVLAPEPQPEAAVEITHVIRRYPDVEALALSWVECQSYGRSDTATAGCPVHPESTSHP